MGAVDFHRYRVKPGEKVHLGKIDPGDTSGFDGDKKDGLSELEKLQRKLEPLQEVLFAQHKHRILIILQGMDTSGKDGTIRRVFEGVNPEGVRVAHFGVPTPEEKDRDFLWRAHAQVPGSGEVVIFNRSHYEGVLVERVHGLVPRSLWESRYKEIDEFERMLTKEGTTIMKFFLNIDEDEQKKRLKARLDDPTKHWKFSLNDLPERRYWSEYMQAYQDVLEKTSTESSPWYLVPSNHAWFRDLLVCGVIVKELERLKMRYPSLPKDDRGLKIK
jgi:PPK2 family polyphosphate:nucleotide phosphotransferase